MKKKISKLKEKAVKHKTLIQNFSYLSALQGFNMLLPLITYPYLIRVLGGEQYGLVIYAQIIVAYFGILVDYGFKVSATRDISIHRDDKNKLSEIISSILTIKLILWLISLIILIILVLLIPQFREEKLLFLFSFGIIFNELLFPQWYFQGIERMKYITIINLIARIIFLILIFVVVREKGDYLYIPLLHGIGAFIGGIIGLYVVIIKDGIIIRKQSISKLIHYFKESSALFGSNAIISIKDKFNVIFIGIFLGMKEVAIYDLATKIMGLLMQPIDIINTTIYPKIAKEKNMKFLVKTSRLVFIIILVAVLLIQTILSPVIEFLGKDMTEAILPTRILLFSPLIMVWSLAFGRNCLIVFGKYKIFTWGMFFTTLFYIILIGISFYFDFIYNLYTFIIIVPLVYLFELLYRYSAVKYLKLMQFTK